jgi:2-haloacid dehalogenase
MINFSGLEVLTFDCYGTLIDWETGILSALRGTLSAHGVSLPDAEVLRFYGDFEAEAEEGPYREYREVLRSVVRSYGVQFSFSPSASEIEALPDSLRISTTTCSG